MEIINTAGPRVIASIVKRPVYKLTYIECKAEIERLSKNKDNLSINDIVKIPFIMARWQMLNPQFGNNSAT